MTELTRLVFFDIVKEEFCRFILIEPFSSLKINLEDFDSHFLYKYKFQIKQGTKWVDHIPYQNIIREQENKDGIRYLYFPGEKSKSLVIVFQGIKDVNRKTYYNYIKTLKDIKAPKIYIKDDYGSDLKTRTSYYLGPNKTFTIAKNVLHLIENFREKLDVDKKNVICCGSSKGGFASIYFGFMGEYGHVVAGGPQILIGNYLSKGKVDGHEKNSILPPILEYLCGSITIKDIEWANNILFNRIKSSNNLNNRPYIKIHVGEKEPHYQHHVVPLLEYLERIQYENIDIDLGDYDTHKDLAKYFPSFLEAQIKNIVKID